MTLKQKKVLSRVVMGGLILAGAGSAGPLQAQDAQGPFHVQAEWKIGGDGFWD